MVKYFVHSVVITSLFLAMSIVQPIQHASAQFSSQPSTRVGQLVSPEGLLNPDGTLRLDGGVPGSLDLKGWNVSLDPGRGPVFSPAKSGEAAPLASGSPGNWSDMGGGGGGALNFGVRAVAVSGSNVYVGGWFTDLDNIRAAGYIARWNGSSWSALGSNGSGYSSLNSAVLTIAVSGTNVYVGGYFTDVNNGATVLNAADYVAKWDGSNWSALGSNGAAGNGSLNNSVRALAVDGSGNVYVGGIFTNVNNSGTVLNAADYVAKWDGSNWSALGSNGAAGNGSLNTDVYAIAASGSNVYVGGIFTDVNNNGTVLTAADYVAKWDGSNWSALGHGTLATDGSLNHGVYAIAVSGTNVYVGGDFTDVHNSSTVLTAADYVAKWDGSNWSALGSGAGANGSLNGNVIAIAVSGTNVYVGGGFTNVNNGGTVLNAADYVAKWDGANWSALGSNGAGGGSLNSGVLAIAVDGSGNVYVGGDFYNVNNNGTALGAADYVSKWDTTNWSAMGAVQGSLNHTVYAMAVSGTNVYVGGYFTHVVNHGTTLAAADYIAKWDGTNWSALGHGTLATDGSLNGTVSAIAVSGTNVYVGGWFNDVNNNGTVLTAADYVATWDGSNWSALGSNGAGDGSLNSGVNSIAVSGTNVYVGGNFTDVNNGLTVLTAADYVAKWNGSNWSALGHATSTNEGSLPSNVYALAVDGSGNVYVGGSFNYINNNGTVLYAAAYVAKWDGGNWSALGHGTSTNDGSLNYDVYALAVDGSGNVYVGGGFYNVNNNGTVLHAANNVAKWDGSNWSALGHGTSTNDGSLNSEVRAIAVYGSNVYVGGNFTDVNNNGTILGAADHVAEWNGTNWSALGSNGAGDGSINAPTGQAYVNALAVNSTDLYVGGYFYNVNNNGSVLPYADYAADYGITNIDVYIGGNLKGSYAISSGGRVTPQYNLLNGPVDVVSTNGQPIFTSERVHNSQGFVNETMGYPNSQLDTEYWFPWYDNISMTSWLLIGNPSTTTAASVHVYIAGNPVAVGSYTIPAGGRVTPQYNVLDGPVHVVSTIPVFTSERVHNSQGFVNEMMGYPNSQLDTEYWFPWYDNISMTSWLLIGNPSTTTAASVHVYIAGNPVAVGSYTIAAGGRVTPQYNVLNGPVHVVSTIPVFTSERVHNSLGFVNEIMGYPNSQLDMEYWFPWYDNISMTSWLLIGKP